MDAETQKHDEIVVISASFELQKLRDRLSSIQCTETKRIVIDLSRIETLDSSGIGALISIQHSLEKCNASLKVIGVSGNILKMFKVMCLDKHFEISGM